ncbi:unnamed protein product [Protopolystoma xenopodis]|uniref:Uncharacterized protein n=1 Tax=Protopolystoma xenopodis TaxID=117903 RepID=A0A3S4ZNI9_9PLAT|nr:unnamed protein product [Protopolystoma xenopodis]
MQKYVCFIDNPNKGLTFVEIHTCPLTPAWRADRTDVRSKVQSTPAGMRTTCGRAGLYEIQWETSTLLIRLKDVVPNWLIVVSEAIFLLFPDRVAGTRRDLGQSDSNTFNKLALFVTHFCFEAKSQSVLCWRTQVGLVEHRPDSRRLRQDTQLWTPLEGSWQPGPRNEVQLRPKRAGLNSNGVASVGGRRL